MRTVYVDSGAFIALLRRKDRDHTRVASHLAGLRSSRDRLITSDAVVAEVATRLRYDVGLNAALAFRRFVETAGRALTVRDADRQLRSDAFDVMAQYADLRLSFPDCLGAVVARRAHADAVFGLDDDFRVLGFSLEPD